MLTIGSLFSGVEGLGLGLEQAGLGPVVWQCETAEYPRRVLRHHYPDATLFGDIRDLKNPPYVGLICGGFPCTDISPASSSRHLGLDGNKSGLWWEMLRIVQEVEPEWVVIENNGHRWKTWMPTVRRALWESGYSSVSTRLRALDVGLPHTRDRGFVVAYHRRITTRGDTEGELSRLARTVGSAAWTWRLQKSRDQTPRHVWMAPHADRQGELQQGDLWGKERGWSDRETPEVGNEGTIEPGLGGNIPRVSHRLDRITALGNAVVPAVGQILGHLIRGLIADV